MRALPLLSLVLAVSACGPSLRMLHESTVYFERCHAIEYDDTIPVEQKATCWSRWLEWYSASQTQTRVLYAQERVVFLLQGEVIDPLPVESSAAAETALPSTPSAEATEPVGPPVRRLQPRTTGHASCEPVCRPDWDACSSRCDVSQRPCIAACQNRYAACMAGCIG